MVNRTPALLFRRGYQRQFAATPPDKGPSATILSLAAFFARFEDAGVPTVILGMDGAEPTPADAAVEGCDRIAWLIHGRNALTGPLEVPGFCLIHLLQHGPSSRAGDPPIFNFP